MKLVLEKEEALKLIHSALCNGGLDELHCSEVELAHSKKDYDEAKAELSEAGQVDLYFEDVLTQILRSGKALMFFDENDQEEVSFNLDQAIENLSKEEALDCINTIKEEQDDAFTGWELLQFCLYGEVIFG